MPAIFFLLLGYFVIPSQQNILALIMLIYIYLIYLFYFKTFLKINYILNLFVAAILLIIYRNVIRNLEFPDVIFGGMVWGQVILLIFFKFIWHKYRENITFQVSSTTLKNIIEKQFNLENKVYKIQEENIEMEKQKILINKIYSQAKLINSILKFDEMIDLCRNILANIIKLPNFVLCIMYKTVFETCIKHNITKEMENYVDYLKQGGMGNLLNNISVYSRIEIKSDINFINKYGKSSLSAVNIFPLIVKDEHIGVILNFEQKDAELNEMLIEYTQITLPQLSMGLKKSLLYQKVEELSQKDGLTKLYLHRVFQKKLSEEIVRVKRYKLNLSLIMLDIDHFKNFNDTYGHLIGDRVLVTVAETILSNIEPPTIAARYGGEEFAVICPEFDLTKAYELAEKLRLSIADNKIDVENKKIGVTISCGVAQFSSEIDTKDNLISCADNALYQAKKEGRNRTKKFF